MNDLVKSMKVALSNTFAMYFKAHGMHWNIEGRDFPQLHAFFGTLYAELHAAVDPFAEEIRALDAYVEYGCESFSNIETITDTQIFGAKGKEMLHDLLMANSIVVASLNDAFNKASDAKNQGLMDFLAGRLDIHAKHAWMIKSIAKGE